MYFDKKGQSVNILVTGAAGFLGSHLTDQLIKKGHKVVGVDNFITGSPDNLRYIDNPNFTFIEHDVCKKRAFNQWFDQIYFLASPASPIDYFQFPLETIYVGSYGCRNYLELAKEQNARFLLTSTSEVYGDPLVHPQTEDYWGNVNPIGPRSVYDESKRYAEALTMAFHRTHGTDVRIARIFNTYGPRMRYNDGRVIPTFINQALQNKPLTVFGDGNQTRSFCYCLDLIDGLVALMNADGIGPYNLGNPNEMTMLELAQEINRITNNDAGVIHKELPEDDPSRRRPDLTKTKRDLKWTPTVLFSEGIKSTIQWFSQKTG
jgi:dTDP-glucose 4,6-dehydratase